MTTIPPVRLHPSYKPPLGSPIRPKVCEAVSRDRSRGLWRPGAWSRPHGPARPAPQPQTRWEEGLPKLLALHTAAAAPPSAAPGAQTEAVGVGDMERQLPAEKQHGSPQDGGQGQLVPPRWPLVSKNEVILESVNPPPRPGPPPGGDG